MDTRASLVHSVVLAVTLACCGAAVSLARDDRPTLLRSTAADSDGRTERLYFALPSGDEDRLVSIFHNLDRAGARRIHAFLPNLIVCEFPVDASPSAVAAGSDVIIVPAVTAEQAKAKYPEGWREEKPYLRYVADPSK